MIWGVFLYGGRDTRWGLLVKAYFRDQIQFVYMKATLDLLVDFSYQGHTSRSSVALVYILRLGEKIVISGFQTRQIRDK